MLTYFCFSFRYIFLIFRFPRLLHDCRRIAESINFENFITTNPNHSAVEIRIIFKIWIVNFLNSIQNKLNVKGALSRSK